MLALIFARMSSELPVDDVVDAGLVSPVADAAAADGAADTAVAAASMAGADGDVAPEKPLFEVQQWNAVCLWSWRLSADICAICTFFFFFRLLSPHEPATTPSTPSFSLTCIISFVSSRFFQAATT
jgi:hypothetical protein